MKSSEAIIRFSGATFIKQQFEGNFILMVI